MAKTAWWRFEETGFDLFVPRKQRTEPSDPMVTAVLLVIFIALITGMTLLIHPKSSSFSTFGIVLAQWSWFNMDYSLLSSKRKPMVIPPGADLGARFRRCRSAGIVMLTGAFVVGFADLGFAPFYWGMIGLMATGFALRMAKVGRLIASALPSTLSPG